MTNKPMLSVELRAFLEGVVKLCAVHGPTYNELRALLDKPELCGTHTGDSCSYCGGSGLKGFQCQSDPVAEVQHGPFDDVGHPQWVRVATLGDFDLEHIPDGTKLFMAPSEQPAPVAVVMPERKVDPGMIAGLTSRWVQGWNEALDEVARLNGVKL